MPQGDVLTRSAAASTHVRVSVMLFLCVLSFLTYYDRLCIVRAQESIQQSLALSDQQLAIVLGAFWLAYGLFEIPGGWMGDRMGARFTLTRIVLAWSLFTALTGAATGFASLLLYRFLFGVGEAGAYPNIAHVQSRWLPITERARAGGVVWLCARSGAAFAPLIFGTITRSIDSAQLSLGESTSLQWFREIESWRIAFFVSGVLGVFWCLAFYPWFRDDPAEKKSVGVAELQHIESGRGPIEAGHAMEQGMWGKLFTSPSLWAVAMYYVCGSFGWSFFVSWMPRYMKVAHGVAFEKSEWSSAWPLLSGGIACLVGGVLSDALVKRTGWRRVGRAVFPICGCSIAAAAMLAIPHVATHRDAVILMCLASAAFDFGQAATWASVVDIGGRYAGVALGFINMIGSLGNTIQPYVGERVFNTFGWNTLFGVYAVAFLLAMTTWTIINPKRRFYEARQ
jgi:MFS transporter, ACS family, glucarate transporter